MDCPFCKIIESDPDDQIIWRRRGCIVIEPLNPAALGRGPCCRRRREHRSQRTRDGGSLLHRQGRRRLQHHHLRRRGRDPDDQAPPRPCGPASTGRRAQAPLDHLDPGGHRGCSTLPLQNAYSRLQAGEGARCPISYCKGPFISSLSVDRSRRTSVCSIRTPSTRPKQESPPKRALSRAGGASARRMSP